MAADPRPRSPDRHSLFWSSPPMSFLPLADAQRCGGDGGRRCLLSARVHSSAAGLLGVLVLLPSRQGSNGCPAQPEILLKRLPQGEVAGCARGGRGLVAHHACRRVGRQPDSLPRTCQRHATGPTTPGPVATPAGHPADSSCSRHRPPAARHHADTPHTAGSGQDGDPHPRLGNLRRFLGSGSVLVIAGPGVIRPQRSLAGQNYLHMTPSKGVSRQVLT